MEPPESCLRQLLFDSLREPVQASAKLLGVHRHLQHQLLETRAPEGDRATVQLAQHGRGISDPPRTYLTQPSEALGAEPGEMDTRRDRHERLVGAYVRGRPG